MGALHYVIIEKFDHENDGHLENSQQIAGANSGTTFSHTNKILQPAGSGISTIVSMKCASTDIFTNVSLKYISTDISNEFVSTEYVSTDVSTESTSIDPSTGLSTKRVSTDVYMHVSVKFVPTNIHIGFSTDNNVIRCTNIFNNISTRIFMDVPTIVINNTIHDIDNNNNNEHKKEGVLDELIKKLRSVSGQVNELMVNSGCIHKHSDDTIKWLFTNKVASKMFDHLNGETKQYNEDIKNNRHYCPNNNQLHKVVEDSLKLTMKNVKLVHHYTAWILFVCKISICYYDNRQRCFNYYNDNFNCYF